MDGPIIVQVGVYNKKTTAAFITWTTDIVATSKVDFGTTTSYGTTVTNSNLSTTHGLQIASLTANTTYHYRVTSVDSGGNSVASPDFSFMTRTTGYLPGDVNGDGTVDVFDLSIVLSNWLSGGKNLVGGNADDDPIGIVDGMDLNLVLRNI